MNVRHNQAGRGQPGHRFVPTAALPALPSALPAAALPAILSALSAAALLVILSATPAAALTIDEAVDMALSGNPRLVESRAAADAALRMPGAARVVPNPEIEVEAVPLALGGSYEFSAGLDQPVPIWGRNGSARRVAVALAEEADWHARDAARSVAAGARVRYRRAVLAHERVAVLAAVRDREDRLVGIAAARKARGEVSEIALRQLEAGLFLRNIEVDAAEDERVTAIMDLAHWIGLADTAGLRLLPVPVADLPRIEDLLPLLPERADLKALDARAVAASAATDLVRAERYDDPTVGLFLRLTRDDNDGNIHRSTFLGGRVTFPLPLLDRRSGAVDLARAEADAAKRTRDAAVRTAELELRLAFRHAGASRERAVRLEDGAAGPARQAVALAEKACLEGRIDAAELTDALNALVETESRRIEAIARWHEDLSVVEEMVGRTLAPRAND